jgi:hypothetical protein
MHVEQYFYLFQILFSVKITEIFYFKKNFKSCIFVIFIFHFAINILHKNSKMLFGPHFASRSSTAQLQKQLILLKRY